MGAGSCSNNESTFAALFIVAPMLYELNYDMHRAAMLTEKLEERETRLTETLEQLQLSAAAANVGYVDQKNRRGNDLG